MKRRDFISATAGLAGASVLQAQEAAKTPFYELRFYRMHQGDQGRRMNEFFSRTLMPLARKSGFPKPPFGPWGFFNVEMGPTPTLVMLLGFPSFADREIVRQTLYGQAEFLKSVEALEADAEPPYDRLDSSLLMGMPFSPALRVADAPVKPPRVFELRVYESRTLRHQNALVRRMADPEVAIFKKSGFDNIFFSTAVIGAHMPNFTYMIAFDDMAARDKAWAAFRADPEWVKVREASIKESGQIVSNITNYILRPTAYSPMQ